MFALAMVSLLGRQIVSMGQSYGRLASAGATERARDALRLHVLGAPSDPRDRGAVDRCAVHAAVGDPGPGPSGDARAHPRCRAELAAPATAASGGGVAKDASHLRLPHRRGVERSL